MKFHESDFSQYLYSLQQHNLHNKNQTLSENFHNKPYHLIINGPSGIGKYTQTLQFIYPFSNSSLKYQKKLTITNEKYKCFFKISDIHVEIDFLTLGCNSKNIWNEIFSNVLNIIYSNQYQLFFIICKNFQYIHNELHDSIYSYMQTFMYNNLRVFFIINTTNISSISKHIYNASYILSLSRPSNASYKKISPQCPLINTYTSIKSFRYDIHMNYSTIYTCLFKMIISNNIDINDFRKLLYDILIYNLNIDDCIWYVITNFYNYHNITHFPIDLCNHIYTFYSQYNNNYRPIYHLELLFLNFIIHNQIINENS